jgi:hypothetical protein
MKLSCASLGVALLIVASGQSRGDEASKNLENAVVAIAAGTPGEVQPHGTGFFASKDGLVITAGHVALDQDGQPQAVLYAIRSNADEQLETWPLQVVRILSTTEGRDIAILRVLVAPQKNDFAFLEFSPVYETGDRMLIAGFPKTAATANTRPLMRSGIVASTRRTFAETKVVALDLISAPGFSGSPANCSVVATATMLGDSVTGGSQSPLLEAGMRVRTRFDHTPQAGQ